MQALEHGNVAGLAAALDAHAEFFLQNRIYLMLNSLKGLAWRNLFKRVWRLRGQPKNLNLRDCAIAMKHVAEPVDDTDLKAVISLATDLIRYGFVQGKISLSHAILVIPGEGEKAFPPIKTIWKSRRNQ